MKLAPSASSRPGWASERWNALNVNKINPLPANFGNPSNPSEEVSKYFLRENTNTKVKRNKEIKNKISALSANFVKPGNPSEES